MEDIKKQYSRICDLLNQLREQGMTTQANLRRLDNQFHLVLAAHALEEITDDELEEYRNDLAQLKRGLNNTRFTIYGLEARQTALIPRLTVVDLNQKRRSKRQPLSADLSTEGQP